MPTWDLERALDNVDGDHTFLADLIDTWLRVTPARLETLRVAFETGMMRDAAMTAHNLRGSAQVIAAVECERTAGDIERIADSESTEGWRAAYDHVVQSHGQLREHVSGWMESR